MRSDAYFMILLLLAASCRQDAVETGEKGILRPQPFQLVELQDGFWAPRLKTQLETLIPFAFEKTLPAVENLRKAGDYLAGNKAELPFPHRYISSDLYKVMEGASYVLQRYRDPVLESKMDSIISIIERAQRDDGYLYVAHITGVSAEHPAWGGGGMGDRPYSHVVHSHELYNMGHMYEAAIAYYQATGKDRWLKVAEKNARHVNRVFFEGDPDYNDGKPVMQAPGHQEIELALTRLYRITGDSLYLEMAGKFLEIRGVTYIPEGDEYMSPTYAQQHRPVAEQREAVGHAVRAAYMYSAMAEVDALRGTEEYSTALDAIWHNIVDTKMHITGGLGAQHGIEGFGPAYELPNADAYNETCAAVGNVFWNFRMFLKYRDARYLDVAEVSLYNNALAGVNLEGNKFFYVNPLESDGRTPFNHGKPGRSPWFNTACCPSNIARLVPQVGGMIYALDGNDIYLGLYASNSTELELNGTALLIRQETLYPWDGKVTLVLSMEAEQEAVFHFRIPTWTSDRFVPGELYRYTNMDVDQPSVSVNGQEQEIHVLNGFAVLERRWKNGDRVELDLPMGIHLNRADARVKDDEGKIAITRGPLVYCAEAVDNISLDDSLVTSDLRIQPLEILPGHVVQSIGVQSRNGEMNFVPYYSWGNRGNGAMKVWVDVED